MSEFLEGEHMITDSHEAARALISRFSEMQSMKATEAREPSGEAMDEQEVELFAQLWEDVDSKIKEETIEILSKMGRKDVVTEIEKISEK